jgi:hypothetical protein
MSLKAALEVLLGRPCYHMREVFAHPEHVPVWHEAALGRFPDWAEFLADYGATADAPAAYFWPELSQAFPDAIVLLPRGTRARGGRARARPSSARAAASPRNGTR